MKKISIFLIALVILPGCATYKFEKGASGFEKGYVVSREGRVMPEYTLGKENSVPENLDTAKERFNRRKATVEQYYEKMGLMKTRLQETALEPPKMIVKLVGGIFRLPFIGYSDYKYEHDPKYRQEVIKLEDEKFNAEKNRLKSLKEELSAYVQKDVESEYLKPQITKARAEEQRPVEQAKPVVPTVAEQGPVEESTPAVSEAAKEKPVQEEWLAKETETPEQIAEAPEQKVQIPAQKEKKETAKEKRAKVIEEKLRLKEAKNKKVLGEPAAMIIAKPLKGFSPLKVQFYGTQSRSPNGRIISYEWGFGDGDKSTKPNPANTYYSTTFEPKIFTATLTVTDSKGGSATSTIEIEVLNK